MVSGCVAGIQFDGSLEFLASRLQIPVEAIQDESQRVVSFTERGVQFQSLDCRRFRFRKRFFGRHYSVLPVSQQSVGVGQPRISRSVFWILFDGLFEISQSGPQTICRALVPEVASFKVGLISLGIDYLSICQRGLFPWSQRDTNLICDGRRHPVLKGQSVTQLPLIALRP